MVSLVGEWHPAYQINHLLFLRHSYKSQSQRFLWTIFFGEVKCTESYETEQYINVMITVSSSLCSLIKTPFEVTTLLLGGVTPPCRQLDTLPALCLFPFPPPSVVLLILFSFFFHDHQHCPPWSPVGGKPTLQESVCHLWDSVNWSPPTVWTAYVNLCH